MNLIKKILGIVWLALGLAVGYYGITILGIPKLTSGKQDDLVFGIIICFILLPIVVGGLLVFGKYALQGEYDLIGPVLLNANTGIATIDFNGIYVINCGVQLTTANVIGSRVLRVAKNDVTVIAEQQWESNLVSGQFQIQNISITAQLEAKDLISVQVFNADGAINPITINTGGTYWGIHRLALT